MKQNNNKPKRKFIPQPIGDTLKKINRNFSSKFGKIEFIVHSKWPEIVGAYFSEYSQPQNILRLPEYENEVGETVYKNYLNVSIYPAAALEFQHFKDRILEKINSYFGYKAIMDLRIQQNYIPNDKNINKMNNKTLTINETKNISEKVRELSNKELKDSLIDLGKRITKDSK